MKIFIVLIYLSIILLSIIIPIFMQGFNSKLKKIHDDFYNDLRWIAIMWPIAAVLLIIYLPFLLCKYIILLLGKFCSKILYL